MKNKASPRARLKKDARLEIRLPSETKSVLQRAAAIAGMDVSVFAVQAATDRANEVILRENQRILSDRDRDRFLEILEETEPNQHLIDLMGQYKATKHG